MPGDSQRWRIASRLRAMLNANGSRRGGTAAFRSPSAWAHRVSRCSFIPTPLSATGPPPYFPSSTGWNSTRSISVFASGPDRYKHPDPRIVIVDIDQRSQEILGRWPFSRTHFAHMLDALREDGAKVAAFDITFSKPDETAAPIRELRKTVIGAPETGRAHRSSRDRGSGSPVEGIRWRRTIRARD